MASGYNIANGQDLDTVFAPQHPGWPQASATEFFDGSGNDLNLRYAQLSTGSILAADTELITSSDVDLRQLFAAYGTTGVQVLTQPAAMSGSASAGHSGTVTSNTTTCAGTKGGATYTYAWHVASGSGFTFTAPNSATTAVTATVPAAQTITGSAYCTISDGITSVNTVAVPVSLQNTSPAVAPIAVSISATASYPSAASALVSFDGAGVQWQQTNQFPSGAQIGKWDPEGDGTNYDIRATLLSGTAPNWYPYTNLLNTWIQATGSGPVVPPSWGLTVTNSNGATLTCTLRIDVGAHGSGVVYASANVTLTVRDSP